MSQHRLASVRTLLAAENLSAILFCDPVNLRYLCGFTGSDGALLITAKHSIFLTDSRYTTQARQQVSADEIRAYQLKAEGVGQVLREQGVERLGFEAEFVSVALLERLRAKADDQLQWQPLGQPLAALRCCKDETELAALERAAALNAVAFAEVLPLIRPGVAEQEIALALEMALRRRGGEERAFEFIVAAGERGALPHGVASSRKLRSGELVTIDFGVRLGGYHSDETVTLALGEISAEARAIFDCVLRAHDLALEAIKPGVSLREIDAVAREHITAQGYGAYFGHGLGHGVGLRIHEFPTASPRTEDVACEGMVFTVEPGIYVPELGGVRIEDMVAVTASGCRVLTKIPKSFREIPG